MEPYARIDARRDEPEDVTYLPLMDCESKLLPIHFLTQAEVSFMKQFLYEIVGRTFSFNFFFKLLLFWKRVLSISLHEQSYLMRRVNMILMQFNSKPRV